MKNKPDKYDRAIAYLSEHPEEIDNAWNGPLCHPAGSLFTFCGDEPSGCLTQIKHEKRSAATRRLTRLIRADDRIPDKHDITVESLPVFAEWQRRIDKELKRK